MHLGQSDLLGGVVPAVASEVRLGAGGADAEVPPSPHLETARVAATRPGRGGAHALPAPRHAAARSRVEDLAPHALARAGARVQLSIARTAGDASAVTHLVRLRTARREGAVPQSGAQLGRRQRVGVKADLGELAVDEASREARRLQAAGAAYKDGGGGRVQCGLFRRDAGAIGPWRATKIGPVHEVAAAAVGADSGHVVPPIAPHPRQCRIHGRALRRVDQMHLDPHGRPEVRRKDG